MPQSINVNAKKRGRPISTGTGTVVGVRMLPEQLTQLDDWIASQPAPVPTRPEAVRQLLARALA
jgi:hypothetical protein